MSNHLHLFCKATNGFILSDVIRDFKKSCEHLKREQQYKVWQDGYYAEHIYSNLFIKEKIEYINNNPVKDKVVSLPEDYYFSSARIYASLENELEVVLLELF
jgi:REP element-mobilizing transposase RayT